MPTYIHELSNTDTKQNNMNNRDMPTLKTVILLAVLQTVWASPIFSQNMHYTMFT